MGAPGGGGTNDKNVTVLTVNTGGFVAPEDGKLDHQLAGIHPGLEKVRSVVLHRFGTGSEYRGWLREMQTDMRANPQSRRARPRGAAAAAPAGEAAALLDESPARDETFTVTRKKSTFALTRSERNTPPLFGAGLLDRVPAAVLQIIAREQRGTVNGRVHEMSDGRIGRFGWKAQTESLREFVLVACAGELGLEVPGHHQSASPLAPEASARGLDLSQTDCDALIAYIRTIPPPVALPPADSGPKQAHEDGKALFASVGCAGCHVPDLGDVSGVYSDLLLHDMGPGLSDGGQYYGSGSPGDARPSEWRTPPLWGFRDSAPYLHDGRARTLDEAVAHHGGQAADAKTRYFDMSARSRSKVEAFLKTLVAPTAQAIASVAYPSDADARLAMKRRTETEEMLLAESVRDVREAVTARVAEATKEAEKSLADARRIAGETRVKAAEVERQAAQVHEEQERTKLSIGRLESLLASARDLERAGKTSAALTFYRTLVKEYKHTEQGRIAAERVKVLAPPSH
jgi:mono/diheme cytochrome c family protein